MDNGKTTSIYNISLLKQIFFKLYSLIIKFAPKPLLKLVRSVLFFLRHNIKARTVQFGPLPSRLENAQGAVLLFGHSNYLKSTGGTERIIISEVEELLLLGKDNVFVFPKVAPNRVGLRKPKHYGVILNGCEICKVKANELNSFLTKMNPSEVRVHHILQWPITDFIGIFKKLKAKNIKTIVYIHDFLFTCPKVNKFCLSGIPACNTSFYPYITRSWKKLFTYILDNSDVIRVPSEFMKTQLNTKYSEKIKVLSPYKDISTEARLKRKIAYLGYSSPIKGYETWLSLSKNALVTRLYELIHIGQRTNNLENVPSIPYSFHFDRHCVASNLLAQNHVNYVLLWSQVPESFSFTFHEAVQAKTFVITTALSGNIAYEIKKNPELGIVLDDEYALIQFLLKN